MIRELGLDARDVVQYGLFSGKMVTDDGIPLSGATSEGSSADRVACDGVSQAERCRGSGDQYRKGFPSTGHGRDQRDSPPGWRQGVQCWGQTLRWRRASSWLRRGNGAAQLTTAVAPWWVYPWRQVPLPGPVLRVRPAEWEALGGPTSPWLLERPLTSRAPLGGGTLFRSQELGVAPSKG